jgi:hypothetical protein
LLEQYRAQLAEARHEAAKLREQAREQGAAIIVEMREQAQAEARRITEAAHAQIEADKTVALTSLRREVGTLAVTLASRVRRVARGGGQAAPDDQRFLSNWRPHRPAPSGAAGDGRSRGLMQGVSRESLATARDRLNGLPRPEADPLVLAGELFAAVGLLTSGRRRARSPIRPPGGRRPACSGRCSRQLSDLAVGVMVDLTGARQRRRVIWRTRRKSWPCRVRWSAPIGTGSWTISRTSCSGSASLAIILT